MRQRIYSDALNCTPNDVWAYLADLRNDVNWRREIVEVDVLSGTPPLAPAAYREQVEWSGMRSATTLEVTESVPGSRLVVIADGSGYSSRSVWTFEPRGPGTIVTLNFSLEATIALGMTEPILWKLVDGWLSRDLPLLVGHLSCA